jgi:hypothetical protein
MQALHDLELLIDGLTAPAEFHWMVNEGFLFLGKRKASMALSFQTCLFLPVHRVIGNGSAVKQVK